MNKNLNPSGYWFYSWDEENSVSHENRLIGFEDVKSFYLHTYRYIHDKNNYQNQLKYTYIFDRYNAFSMRKQHKEIHIL